MKKIVLLLAFFAIGLQVLMAQTREVTGTVTSADDGGAIPGVSVSLKGTTIGTITDMNGTYKLKVPQESKTLIFSFVGMTTQEVEIGTKSVVNVTLSSGNIAVDEVVVTAMGIKRSERALGFSSTSVKGEAIASKRTNDVMSSLAGKVAGVQISATSSDPGASNSVIIRGFSSLSGTNQPLYIVDGVPLNNSAVYSSDGLNSGYDFGNGANAVNPDDVESVSILKGAAATALYGSRAASGVILITTKSGQQPKKGLGIEYNGGLQLETLLRIPQMQNEFGMGWYGDHTEIENGSWGPRLDGSMQLWGHVYNNSQKWKPYSAMENNIKDFFDEGFRYNNSIAFNGATDKSDYYVSFSQISEDGMIPTDADSYDKYTFSARGSHKTGNLTFTSSLNYAEQQNSFVTTGQGTTSMYNSIMQTPRDISIISLANLNDPFNMPGYYYTPYGITNPYYVLNNYKNEYETSRFYGKFQMDYDFLKYFKFTYRFGLDQTTGHRTTGSPNLAALFPNTPNYSGNLDSETGGTSQQTTRRREINQDILLNFTMPVSDFNISALAGFNGNERRVSSVYAAVTKLTIPTWYDLSNSSEIPSVDQTMSLRRLMGVFGQADVSWKDLVYMTLTARNDWSSTLPKDNRSFFYPGLTSSFVFTELIKNDDLKRIISFGKIRAAWGKTGNDADPYMTSPVYAQATAGSSGWGTSAFPFQKVGVNAYSAGNVLGSNNLSPEMTTELEFGANMAFLNNRISFDAAYYDRNTDKQIFSLSMDPASGFTAQNMNLGKVRNHGIELLINTTPVKTKDFKWDLSWNFTKNYSKVVDLPDELGGSSLIWGFSGGTGLYAIEGEEMGVFKAVVPEYDPEGHIVVNSSTGQPVPAAEKIVGSMNYKYQMGFSTSLNYKGFTVSADLDVRNGGLMFSRTKDIEYFTGNAIQTAYNDRNPFIVPNSVNKVTATDGTVSYVENTVALDATQIYNYWNNGATDLASGFLIDKSYTKLRTLAVSWDLPTKWFKKTVLNNVRVSVFGNNLFVWTPSGNTFVDPEMTSFGNDLEGNFGEYSANPASRRFGFNLMVKF